MTSFLFFLRFFKRARVLTFYFFPSLSLFAASTITVNLGTDVDQLSGGKYLFGLMQQTDLRGALNQFNTSPGTFDTINFSPLAGSQITLGAMLPLLNLVTGSDAITIDGNISGTPIIIDGGNQWRAFFARKGTVTLKNMTIQNVVSQGGTGGGGGMGAGAALFVDSANVTLTNVVIKNSSVIGGTGGSPSSGGAGSGVGGGGLGIGSNGIMLDPPGSNAGKSAYSGSGGFGGNGATNPSIGNFSGGGGGGINCGAGHLGTGGTNGSTVTHNGGNGGVGGGIGAGKAGDGGGGDGIGVGGTGGTLAGGGGGGAFGIDGFGGGGGGIGIPASTPAEHVGGMGGYGGGGGSAGEKVAIAGGGGMGGFGGGGGNSFFEGATGGTGGFGGGGGGGGPNGGDGGFGGGGGGRDSILGIPDNPGAGGVGGGKGSSTVDGFGGGGAGFGGAIFVNTGSLTISGTFNTNGSNSATKGSANTVQGASEGWQAGNDCFFLTTATIHFDPQGSSNTITITSSIADDSPSSFTGAPAGVKQGMAAGVPITIGNSLLGGTVIFLSANTYSGGTTIDSGILQAGNNTALGGAPSPGTTVTGGSLQLLSGISIPSTQSLGLSGSGVGGIGALTQASNVSSTYGGPILLNNSATIGTNGSGTLALTGGININGHTLTFTGGVNGSISITSVGISGLGNSNIIVDGVRVPFTLANTYRGSTTILNGGTVSASALNALPATRTVLGVDQTGSGHSTLELGADQSIRSIEGVSSTSTVNLNNNNLTIGTAVGSTAYAGSIIGTGGIIKDMGSIQIFSGTTTYSGNTVVHGGTLGAVGIDAFSPNSTFLLDDTAGVILALNGFSQTIFSLSGGGTMGGNITLGASTGILTISNGNSNTYSGSISGAGGVTISSATFFILDGTNSYSGNTTVNQGILRAGATDTFSPNSEIILANAAGVILDLNGFSQTIGALGGGGSTGGNVLMGGVTLITGATSSSTFSGIMSGTGGNLVKMGALTTFTLAGPNSYTGTTTVQEGILQAANTNVIPSSSNVILANALGVAFDLNNFSQTISTLSGGGASGGNVTLGSATLTSGSGGSSSYGGSISGTGGIVKLGSGTFTLTGVNTYTGTATINGGILALSGNGALSPQSGVSIQSGQFDISAISAPGTQIGDLSGNSGTLVKLGNKTLRLGTANSTTFSGSIQSGGIAGGSPGSLVKEGSGTLNVTGTNTYGGPTTINGGNLAVNGNLISSLVTVAFGATLSGASIIFGDVINHGTVSPGNSIGTLTVIGSYTQTSNSTLLIEVNPSVADLLRVVGPATIDPNATLHIVPFLGMYTAPKTYTILSSSGLSGTFTNVVDDMPAIEFRVRYDDFNVYLDLIAALTSTSTCGGNVGTIASYLAALPAPRGSDLALIINAIIALGDPQLIDQALAELQPAPYKNLILAQEENVFSVSRAISDHLNTMINTRCQRKVDRKHQSEVWTTVFGDYAKMDTRESSHCTADNFLGYHSKGGGGLIGFDYSFTNQYVLGAAAGYSYSGVFVNQARVKGHINSGYGALYAMLQDSRLFVDASFIAGYSAFDASRQIQFGPIDRRAYTHHGGWDIDGHLDAGLIIDQWKAFEIRPFLSLDGLLIHENGHHERGANSLDLVIEGANSTLFRGEGGVNFSKCLPVHYGKWIPELRASVVREAYYSSAGSYRSHLVHQESAFTVKNKKPNRTLFSPGAKVTGVFYEDKMWIEVDYFGEYGKSYSNQVFKAEFSWVL